MRLFSQMQYEGFKPSQFTLGIVLRMCSEVNMEQRKSLSRRTKSVEKIRKLRGKDMTKSLENTYGVWGSVRSSR
ncbi:hypothetical protein L2E82_25350 [Cichorium intybus]|uniref:Uncharacterized protein n=1 Tax=Cichorium intybus TaxID=13427 RepID=A0ACB9E381_CICIN|nr:hypothetical protein L2E82_25350 [Cichorium intybus]